MTKNRPQTEPEEASSVASKKRLQFDFDDDAVQALDELVAHLNAASRAEVIRRALALLDYVVQSRDQGWELTLERPDGEKQRLVFF